MLAYQIKLYDLSTGRAINHSGKAIVMAANSPAKQAIFDASGAAASNPVTIANGQATFYTAETVLSVDVSIYTGYGYATFVKGLKPGVPQNVFIDLNQLRQTLVVPFSTADASATVEYDTGIELVVGNLILPEGLGAKVTTAQSAKTVDLGLDGASAEDDPNGLLAALSLATAGTVLGTVGYAVGTNSILVDVTGGTREFTYGELMCAAGTKVAAKADGTDSATTKNGFYLIEPYVVVAASANITYTLSSATTAAAGYFVIPQRLPMPAGLV